MRKLIAALLLVMFVASPAFAAKRLASAAKCSTEGGSEFVLDPGSLVLSEPEVEKLDLRMRELQDDVTRLKAENTSLEASLRDPGGKWYWWLAAGIVVGLGGAYSLSLAK